MIRGRRVSLILSIVTAWLLLAATLAASHHSTVLICHTTAAGGGPLASGSYGAQVTIAQPIVGRSSAESYQVGSGFWALEGGAEPVERHRIYLPMLTKASPSG